MFTDERVVGSLEAQKEYMETPIYNYTESMSAAADLAQMDALGETVGNIAYRKSLSSGMQEIGVEKLSVDQLKEKFPDVEDTFKEPEYEAVAKFNATNIRKRRMLEDVMAHGPSGALATAGVFGASMFGMLRDEAEFGVMAGTVGLGSVFGIGRSAALGARVVRAGEVVRTGSRILKAGETIPTMRSLMAANQIENAIQLLPSQIAMAMDHTASGLEYTLGDFAQNMAIGTVATAGMDGFVHGVGALAGLRKRFLLKMNRTLMQQIDAGLVPNVGPLLETHIREQYTPGKYVHAAPTPETKFYAPTETTGGTFLESPSLPIGDYIGPGVYLTDNPYAANGVAASRVNDIQGDLFEFNLNGKKIVDYNQPFPESMRAEMEVILNSAQVSKFDLATESAVSILERMRAESPKDAMPLMNKVVEAAKKAGFDGSMHDGARIYGREAPGKQNIVNIFDKSGLKKVNKIISSTTDGVPDLTKQQLADEIERVHKPQSEIGFSQKSADQLAEIKVEEPKFKDRVRAHDEAVKATSAEFEAQVKEGYISEEDALSIDEAFKKEMADEAEAEKILRSYARCRGVGGISG